MQQRVQFCRTVDGLQIAFATHGSGHPLVLVPGWVSHLELDMEVPESSAHIAALASEFTVVRFDKRGTGLSDRTVHDFSLDARLRDLEAVVDHLGLDRFALRGVSEGGPVAIAYAVRHPERVSHLMLLGTFAHLGHSGTSDALIALVAAEWGLGSATMANMFMPSASKERTEFFARYQREGAKREDAAAMLRANIETDVRDILDRVRAPTLVMHSESDRAVPFEHARLLAAGIRNASLVRYKGDHVPVGAYGEIEQLMREFLANTASQTEPSRSAAPGGLLTMMFTDIEASTATTQRLGDAGAQYLLRKHNDIIRKALRINEGTEIKHTGDGVMASFPTASAALECAAAIQRAFADHNVNEPDARIRVRVGLNAGEPVAEDGDLFGTAVQLAARICARAEPGQVLVANVVRELAAGKPFLFSDQGDVVLRGFEDPVRLFELHWG